jgi:hypothetical protein
MRVKILPSALNDLANGRSFYEQQNPGVGDYLDFNHIPFPLLCPVPWIILRP